MLYLLFTAIFIIPALLGIGTISEKIFGKNYSYLSIKILFGILTLSVVWAFAAFFIPINLHTEVVTLSLGLIGFYYFRVYNDLSNFILENKNFLFPLLLTIVFAGSFYPFILDHFGYYVTTIKWINEFGLVKGISNLDLLLGQMSVWHIFQAGFSSFSDVFLRLNTVLLIIYIIYVFEKKSWVHLCFIPILFLFAQSPSPDLPSVIFSLIILNEIFSGNKDSYFLFALSAYTFAIKPTMIWVPLFALLYALLVQKEKLKTLIPGILILALFVFKNIWTFGYPIFPVQIGDLGISWKPNHETLKISSEVAIQKTFDMQYSVSEINNFGAFDYIKNWLTLKGIKSLIHISFLISIIVFTLFAISKKKKIYTFLWVSILIKSALVLLFSAQYRFFIDVFFVLAFVLLFEKITRKNAILSFSVLGLAFSIFLSFPTLLKTLVPSFRLGHFMLGFDKKQIIIPSHFQLKEYKTHQIGNLKFNVVEGYSFSFDIPTPAISPVFLKEYDEAGIFPQKISHDIKDGFIWRKMTDAEHLQLKKILEERKNK